MRYKLFGKSGLRVSELCLGTMTFGEDWGWGGSREECRNMFEAYAEAGGNFIDTANHYTNGTSETFVGEFIAQDRQRFVLSTKYTLNGRPSDPNGGGNHRKSMIQALDASLKRLGTDYIDIYWLHAWDFMTPIEEVMRALDDLVRAGKVLYVGISDSPAWVIARANMLAELRGWSPFVGLQVPYSLIERTPEREFLPMAQSLDIAVCAWGAIGGGVLTGEVSRCRRRGRPGRGAFRYRQLGCRLPDGTEFRHRQRGTKNRRRDGPLGRPNRHQLGAPRHRRRDPNSRRTPGRSSCTTTSAASSSSSAPTNGRDWMRSAPSISASRTISSVA